MKLNSKDPGRQVLASFDNGGVVVQERIAYQPTYQLRRKWDDQRVWLTVEEIDKLHALAHKTEAA